MTFKGHSRSSKMSLFDTDTTRMIFYYRSVIIMALSSTVSHSDMSPSSKIAKCTYPACIQRPRGGNMFSKYANMFSTGIGLPCAEESVMI